MSLVCVGSNGDRRHTGDRSADRVFCLFCMFTRWTMDSNLTELFESVLRKERGVHELLLLLGYRKISESLPERSCVLWDVEWHKDERRGESVIYSYADRGRNSFRSWTHLPHHHHHLLITIFLALSLRRMSIKRKISSPGESRSFILSVIFSLMKRDRSSLVRRKERKGHEHLSMLPESSSLLSSSSTDIQTALSLSPGYARQNHRQKGIRPFHNLLQERGETREASWKRWDRKIFKEQSEFKSLSAKITRSHVFPSHFGKMCNADTHRMKAREELNEHDMKWKRET